MSGVPLVIGKFELTEGTRFVILASLVVVGFGWLIYRVILDELRKARAKGKVEASGSSSTPPPLPKSSVPRSRFILGYAVSLGIGAALGFVLNQWIIAPIAGGAIAMATHWEVEKGKSPFHYVLSAVIVLPVIYIARRAGWF